MENINEEEEEVEVETVSMDVNDSGAQDIATCNDPRSLVANAEGKKPLTSLCPQEEEAVVVLSHQSIA